MTEYAFPKDLLDAIRSRWESVPDEQFTLPNDQILQKLLETCYHSSFRTSEQRTVQCVVAYASSADIPDGVLQLANRPVILTDSELVRLSPVTQHRQTVIGCDQMDGWLRIWGFFEHGHAWVQHSAGDPTATPIQPVDFPPDCLTIAIDGPGALTISRGRTGLVRLRDGQTIFPKENLLQSEQNPLGIFIHELVADLQSCALYGEPPSSTDESVGQRSLLNIYTTSILSILERVRLRQHGGSVVISRVPFEKHLAHVTYAMTERTGLIEDIMAYKSLFDLLRTTESTPDTAAELERSQTELALGRTSRRLIRGISQISLLAAVDGAVLLDHHLRIQGFGVRFPLILSPDTTVLNALTGSDHMCDQWGLRHQSVFSVCQACEQAMGLIVSQDGEVKAVKAVDGQLMFWDGILD